MLKLAFSTLPCDGWSVEKMINHAQKSGYKGIEVRESPESWASVGLKISERDRIRELFAAENIFITNIGSSVCVLGHSKENRAQKMENLTANIKLASDLNARGVRIFLGNFITRYTDAKEPIDHKQIVTFIREACEVASGYGIEIWIETHNEYGNGKAINRILSDVNRENYGVIWDVIHPLEDGEKPQDTYNYLGKWCWHIHIKDGKPYQDPSYHCWEYTRLGDGIIPNKDIIQLLLNNGFDGFFSLEWESKWRQELQFPGSEGEKILPQYVNYMNNLIAG